MKDRITLGILLVLLWVFLFIYQKYIPFPSSGYLIIGFCAVYALLLHAGQNHQRRKNKKNPPKLDTSYEPFVSIIIPAHNEDTVIFDTIKNVLKLDYEKYEILVVDDRSTDNTPAVLKQLSECYSQVRYHIRQNDAFPGKSAVLNEALKMTKGEVICIFDADARVRPEFLKTILPYLADSDTGAVQARKIVNNPNINFLTRCQSNELVLDTHFQAGRDSIRGAVELRGNGFVIKREALADVDGWNNFTITDDLDLSTRLHLKDWDVRFCSVAEVYEEAILNFIPLLRQRRRWVEGSIRRYLDYFIDVLFSKDISFRVSLDMLAYVSEFVLPLWLVSEWVIQGIKIVKGVDTNILSSLFVIAAVCLFFMSGLYYSIRKYNNLGLLQAIRQTLETGIYMVALWTPVVSYIVLKIIFLKRSMDWGKTVHGIGQKAELEEYQVFQ